MHENNIPDLLTSKIILGVRKALQLLELKGGYFLHQLSQVVGFLGLEDYPLHSREEGGEEEWIQESAAGYEVSNNSPHCRFQQ